MGDIDDLKRQVEMDYSLFKTLTPIDDANIQWVFEVLHAIDSKFDFRMSVVKFKIDETRSVVDKKMLMINHLILTQKYEILHEAVNFYCSRKDKEVSLVWKELYQRTCEGLS